MRHCLIFSHKIFYATYSFTFKYSMTEMKAVSEITAWQLRKYDVTKVCSIEYLTTEIEISIANFQVLDRSQNYIIFYVRTIV